MAEVSTTHHQVVNQSNMQDLVISKLEFIRLTATSGKASIYVTAETKGENKGIYGPIDADAALLADKLLAKKVLGRNALEHEAIWNDLFDSNRHSRGSHYFMRMSTIDNLLWDLKGKIFGQPVYKILGGNRKQGSYHRPGLVCDFLPKFCRLVVQKFSLSDPRANCQS
jgi:L-alanine-DL-glutamate epimerase-like enolase superfamily enzyme